MVWLAARTANRPPCRPAQPVTAAARSSRRAVAAVDKTGVFGVQDVPFGKVARRVAERADARAQTGQRALGGQVGAAARGAGPGGPRLAKDEFFHPRRTRRPARCGWIASARYPAGPSGQSGSRQNGIPAPSTAPSRGYTARTCCARWPGRCRSRSRPTACRRRSGGRSTMARCATARNRGYRCGCTPRP